MAARNQFNLKASISSIIYRLRICRQETINISPFEAHLGRKVNTPLSNISTEPDASSLTYKRILNKCLDMERIRWEELISEDNWDLEARSDTELDQNKDRLSKDAARSTNADPDKESRIIPHSDVGLAVPWTETSLSVKLAKKNQGPKVKENP